MKLYAVTLSSKILITKLWLASWESGRIVYPSICLGGNLLSELIEDGIIRGDYLLESSTIICIHLIKTMEWMKWGTLDVDHALATFQHLALSMPIFISKKKNHIHNNIDYATFNLPTKLVALYDQFYIQDIHDNLSPLAWPVLRPLHIMAREEKHFYQWECRIAQSSSSRPSH